MSRKPLDLDEERIIELYTKDKLPVTEIADLYNTHPSTITTRLRKRGIALRGRAGSTPLQDKVSGPLPVEGERAIYYLYKEGKPFYVGSSKLPVRRLNKHNKAFDTRDIYMRILRCVPENQSAYWESKLLVDMIELGYDMPYNTEAPKSWGFV